MLETFERLESEVRGYCRGWPTVFSTARGAEIFDRGGRRYIDLFAGAGALNYGHSHPLLKKALLDYLGSDAIVHSLDMATEAKERFLLALEARVLRPRGLDYKVQFPGPTGTNSVEAALKLARKVTGRYTVASFTNAFHGMTLGSLAVTGNSGKRAGAGLPLGHSPTLPFAGYMEGGTDSLDYFESLLQDTSSGVDTPAAVIVESVQAEGGVNVASNRWLQRLRELTERWGVLLIVDDIQVGCGRTGRFFSFEEAGIEPDIVCLSKSLSGYGLPLSLVLIKPEHDAWNPGEHNGTFRGHNPAFVTATAALEHFWCDDAFSAQVRERSRELNTWIEAAAKRCDARPKGRGMIQGLELPYDVAAGVARRAFAAGVLIETSGARDEVLKVLPPLTIERELLAEGLDIVGSCLEEELRTRGAQRSVAESSASL
ncbi:MAG: diaminobutyrate--2-oxoglutarate transaminase [Myxococcales bacterium]|nr:diaminobutyrate--2-oxoglutarate transaminase [Myxococcales bacterium]